MNSYSSLDPLTHIRKQRLDPYHYTISLIQEGTRAGQLEQETVEEIQVQLMSLLAELILRYNAGESTSLKTETAQRILLSILYSMDACMLSLNGPEEALTLLKKGRVREIYDRGVALVASCREESERLYEEIMDTMLDVPIVAYHSTLNSLGGCFRSYDLIFDARDIRVDIDYPLLFDDMQMEGIFYIRQYLQKLQMETEFCRHFNIADVKKLLHNYGRVYRINYRESLINVFEIVLTNAIFSVISGSKAVAVRLSWDQYKLVKGKLSGLDPIQCRRMINQAIQDMMAMMGIDQPGWKEYISRFTPLLLPRLLSALESNCLDNVIILDQEQKQLPHMLLDEGRRMDDDSFRSLINKILSCSDREEKAAIITASTHSIGDFVDVLEADCMFGEEYRAVFSILGDMELSLLARIVFVDEIRADPAGFTLEKDVMRYCQEQWQTEYVGFLSGLSKKRLRSVDQYIHASIQLS